MYEPSGKERLVPIDPALPQANAGAPIPRIAASEGEAAIVYWTHHSERQVALVRFFGTREIALGGPNDETIQGHPLYLAGLQPYTFTEVLNSPWVAALEHRNRVHPRHDPAAFSALRHFVLPCHDSTFECIARDLRAEVTNASDPASALADLVDQPS
jgi:hypothetical protein